MSPTMLKIQGAGMPALMVEECTQTLERIPLGGLHRTVNGDLVYTGDSGTTKYRSVCSGKGKGGPGFDKLKRGDGVEVQCIQRLWQETSVKDVTLSRPAVEGTLLAINAERQGVAFTVISSSALKLARTPQSPVYISYCPVLTMRVVEVNLETLEWGESVLWTIILEEV